MNAPSRKQSHFINLTLLLHPELKDETFKQMRPSKSSKMKNLLISQLIGTSFLMVSLCFVSCSKDDDSEDTQAQQEIEPSSQECRHHVIPVKIPITMMSFQEVINHQIGSIVRC